MNNHDIKQYLLDLTSLVLDIQMHTFCPTHLKMSPAIGMIDIAIGNEMERYVDFHNPLYSVTIYYFDDWSNESFYANYQEAKKTLEKILQDCLAVNN